MNSKIPVFGALLLLSPIAITNAQQSEPATAKDAEFGEARELLQMGRRDVIREEIRFSEKERAAFWPVYDVYRAEVKLIRNRQADIVIAYLKAHRDGAVSNQQAARLLDDDLAIRGDLLAAQKKHLRHFRKVLPAWKVGRFYQLENKLDAELDVQLARFIPLIDPPEEP